MGKHVKPSNESGRSASPPDHLTHIGEVKKKLTPKTAAIRASVCVSLIYTWCEQGKLPHYRPPGRGRPWKILIDPDDLERFMASWKVEGRSPPPPIPKRVTPQFRHLKL